MNKEFQNYEIYIDKVTKTFNNGDIIANKDVTLRVKKNEIHALLGENGAGKSTLMSILFGLYEQDSGEIYIRGEKVKFNSAMDSIKYKIGMVHQHFKLIDNFTILDNIILGCERCRGKSKISIIDRKESRKVIDDLIQKYQFNLDLDKKVYKLTVAEKQRVEILKLLYLDSEILIFDEPTAVLSVFEINSFLEMVKNFKKQGKTIIIITHKLNEVKQIADICTIMRNGKNVDEFEINENTNFNDVVRKIVGREIKQNINTSTSKEFGNVVLEVKNLKLSPHESSSFLKKKNHDENQFRPQPINFKVHEGEIMAIAGVDKNGQNELIKKIVGISKSKKNEIIFYYNTLNTKTKRANIAFVPEDRQKHGLFLDDTVSYNTVMNFTKNKNFFRFGFSKKNKIIKHAIDIIRKYDVRGVSSLDNNVRSLSGGNQQKLIIGREFSKKSKLIVLFQPTRGVDIGAIEYIHEKIIEYKNKNHAILIVSYELDEVFSLADTIMVMNKYEIKDIGHKSEMTRERVGSAMIN